MATTYILQLSNGQYYVGSTEDINRRLREHQEGRDSYTRKYLPVVLLYREEFPTKEEAWAREKQLHGWSKAKKEALVKGDIDFLTRK